MRRRSRWASSESARWRSGCRSTSRVRSITVAGTNGKGSTCAMLESMLRHAGYRTGALHVAAPAALQRARPHRRRRSRPTRRSSRRSMPSKAPARHVRQSPLTYFEFSTLAALHAVRSGAHRRNRARSRARRQARRREHRRCRRRRRHVDRDRSRRLSRLDSRGHRPGKGGNLPRRSPGDLRRRRSAGVARRARGRDRRAAVAHWPRLHVHGIRRCSGDTAVRPARVTRCRFPRSAAPISSAMQRRRSRRSTHCAIACRWRLTRSAPDWWMSSCRGGSTCCPDARRWFSTLRTIRMPRACSRTRSARCRFIRQRLRYSACWRTRTSTASWLRCAARIDQWYVATAAGSARCGGGADRRGAAERRRRRVGDSRIRRHRTRIRGGARRGRRH